MAVVRVKRHLNEEPGDALLLTCKRRKTEDDNLTSIFKFAATVSNQEENVKKYLSKDYQSPDAKTTHKLHYITNITDKLRADNKLSSQKNRLQVVNCFRSLNESDYLEASNVSSYNDDSITIVEIESVPWTITDNLKSTPQEGAVEGSNEYVYDIYYAQDCELDEQMLDNSLSCYILDGMDLENSSNDVYINEEDSDDSNDECNWRNDYPDEDPDRSDTEVLKFTNQLKSLNISETNSLSSDDGEENFVYGMDDPDFVHGAVNGQYYETDLDRSADKDLEDDVYSLSDPDEYSDYYSSDDNSQCSDQDVY